MSGGPGAGGGGSARTGWVDFVGFGQPDWCAPWAPLGRPWGRAELQKGVVISTSRIPSRNRATGKPARFVSGSGIEPDLPGYLFGETLTLRDLTESYRNTAGKTEYRRTQNYPNYFEILAIGEQNRPQRGT